MEERDTIERVFADVDRVEDTEVVEDDRPAAWFDRTVARVSKSQFCCEGLLFISEQVVVDAQIGGDVVQLVLRHS